jgi:O-antigen/teichoic acid export membrane protein
LYTEGGEARVMSRVRSNLIANFSGNIWTGLISLAFVPIYVRYLGVEAYGLVGFYLTLQSLFSLLDLGFSTTLNREFARLSGAEGNDKARRNLLATLEMIYWGMSILCGLVVLSLSSVIAQRWVKPEHLSVSVIAQTVTIMAAVITVQWPLALYSGGLSGLQKQVTLNAINATVATVRAAGAVAVLWGISNSIVAFFAWQVVVSLANTLLVGVAVWRAIGGRSGARFELSVFRSIWRFAAGMVAISVLWTCLTQIDKLVVSKSLPLTTFGYYTLAGTLAISLYRLCVPIFSAFFPRFSELAAAGREEELASAYHRGCQVMSVVILPAAVFIALFAREIMLLWTHDASTAAAAYTLLSILVIAAALNSLQNLPVALQLAYGWTRLLVWFNSVAVIVFTPVDLLLTWKFGAVGAAFGWLIITAFGIIGVPLLMHRRLLRGRYAAWLIRDVGEPLLACAVAAAIMRVLIAGTAPTAILLLQLFLVACIVQAAACLAAPDVRGWLISQLRRLTAGRVTQM